MPRLPALLLCLLAVSAWAPAMNVDQESSAHLSDEEIESRGVQDLQKRAAAYRVERSRHTPTADEEAGAEHHLRRSRELLADDSKWLNEWRAKRVALKGFTKYGFSSKAGDLLMAALDANLARNDLDEAYDRLLTMWFYLPDYAETGVAMRKSLEAAERRQDFAKSVHLEADEPEDVIRLRGSGALADSDRIFRFLSLHGDRVAIAPRAELGMARSLLLSGSREDLFAARLAYERFLEHYPMHDLTFEGLVEHALSYLVGYRGDDYDAGALDFAVAIIDQAELETRGDEDKAALVRAYRARIRLWQQDRDLRIARWYRGRDTPGLAWLKTPPGVETAEDGARYYYRAVIARDNASNQGRAAERELAELPPARPRP